MSIPKEIRNAQRNRKRGGGTTGNANLRNDEGLTRRQAQFVEDYTRDPESLRKLDLDGARLINQPGVMVAIAKRQAGLDVTPQEIVDNIVRIASKAEATGFWMAALKGQELLGKYKGMWIEKNVNVNIDLARQHVDALVEKMKRRKEAGMYVPTGTEILHIEPIGPKLIEDPFVGF